MLATENHVDFITELTRSRRLKNVEVLMQWMPEAGEDTYVVLLSLREAQTLRRAMQAAPHPRHDSKRVHRPAVHARTRRGWCSHCASVNTPSPSGIEAFLERRVSPRCYRDAP